MSFSQIENEKPFQIIPYIGLSSPQGDFKDFADNGSVFGVTIDKYISNKFALGFDINFQSNGFKNPFDFSSISSPNSVVNSSDGKWNATTFTFGPTYKLGSSKFNAEIYSKFGLLYIKSAEAKSVFVHAGGTKTIFELPEQKRSGFGVTSGIRLNYKVSKKLSLFVNSQYVYSSAEVEYCDCGVEGLSNPDDILDSQPIKKTFKPSYLNVNAGLTFNLGTTRDSSSNRNLPDCFVSLHSPITCTSGGPQVIIKTDWWGQAVNNILSVAVYDGTTLVYSANTITNNGLPLGVSTGARNHNFNAFGYEGKTLTVKITIDDQNGVLNCVKDNFTITIPDCEYETTCGWDFNIECHYSTNSAKINMSSVWSNVPAGSTLNYSIINSNSPGNSIPFTSSPNNLPKPISGTGSATYALHINGYQGTPIVLRMVIIGPDGTVLCTQGVDELIPVCDFITCEPALISANCNNGTPTINFSVPWTNFPLFNTYSIYADIYDSNLPNANLIASITPFQLTAANGSQSFSVNLLAQYVGTTIYVKTKICETGGVKKCCPGLLEIDIPECCEDCSRIKIQNNTNHNQRGESILKSFGLDFNIVNSGSPIKKILITLESFGANNSTNSIIEPIPNFEISGVGIMVGSGLSGTPIGSFSATGIRRSNLWKLDFSPSTFIGSSQLIIYVEKYDRKIIKNYRVKFTMFRTDGTTCEITKNYNN